MDPEVARNIERYRRLFEKETNKTNRQTLLRLLADEEEKLRAAASPSERKRETK